MRPTRGAPVLLSLLLLFGSTGASASPGADDPGTIHVDSYIISATLDPARHTLDADVSITFTVLRPADQITLLLNPGLRISEAVQGDRTLNAARGAGNGEVRISPSASLQPGQSVTWRFHYSGLLDGSTAAPCTAALVGEPVTELPYQSCWFPIVEPGVDRFRAAIHVRVPAGFRVFGSGPGAAPRSSADGQMVFDFDWPQASLPGTIIAGRLLETPTGDPAVHFFSAQRQEPSAGLKATAELAARQYRSFLSRFGPLPWNSLNIIQLPDGSFSPSAAPELGAFPADNDPGRTGRLLATAIARQWWGEWTTPSSPADAWITNGMCRYADLDFLHSTVSRDAFADALRNISADALAYHSVPLSRAAQYPPASPPYIALTYDKGAMVLRMLEWQIGHAAFTQVLRQALASPGGSISRARLEKFAESASQQGLAGFFSQWLDSTAEPELRNAWTLYRMGTGGYRIVGTLRQNTDVFRIPVEIRVGANSKAVVRRVEISGAETSYVIDTPFLPLKIEMDPDRRILRTSPAMQVRVAVLLGMQDRRDGRPQDAIAEYRRALAIDSTSSLASYRLGEVYFDQRDYQAAADAFRAALSGDDIPPWTEVWSDIQLGRVYDALGQSDRAANQYRQALQTADNAGGALDLARQYLAQPRASHLSER